MSAIFVSLLRLLYFAVKILALAVIFFVPFYLRYKKKKINKTTPPTAAYIQANQPVVLNEVVQSGHSAQGIQCVQCGSNKLIRGQFFQSNGKSNYPAKLSLKSTELYANSSLTTKPKHPTIYRLPETYFNCCAECGYVFATADTAKIYEILQIYAKPSLLKRLNIAKLE